MPGWWARIVPDHGGRKPGWAEFLSDGFACETGRQSAGGAMVQVLIMTAVLIGWGLFLLVVSRLV